MWSWSRLCVVFGALVAFDPLAGVAARSDSDVLHCLVCRVMIDEFETAIARLNPNKMVEVGNYKLDSSGNIHQEKVPISRSQVYLSEMLDEMCKKLTDYVRVRYKATKKLAVMKMLSDTGGMNPEFSYTDFVTDEDLNKSLEFYCDSIIGEHEEDIINLYSKRDNDKVFPDGKAELCIRRTNYCEDWMLPNDADRNWTKEDEKKRGPDPYGFGGALDNSKSNDDEGPVENLEENISEEYVDTNKEEL